MQEQILFSELSGPLGRLTAAAYARAAELPAGASGEPWVTVPSMRAALLAAPTVAVIAEVKRRSPSQGVINHEMVASERAVAYVSGGAAAISVLTEPTEFGGAPQDLLLVRACASVPLLRKDFHVTEAQIYETRALGASAVLLIARALPAARLVELVALAHEVGLEALVEVRTDAELAVAVASGSAMIGVNARNLETLVIDHAVVARLLPQIPASVVAIAESGLAVRADVERVASLGADAVLIGSALSRQVDGAAAVAGLCGVLRNRRGA